MANEIRVVAEIGVRKGGVIVNAGPRSKMITMAGTDAVQKTQQVGTSAELLDYGDIAGTPEYFVVTNQDATNFVLLGFTNPPTEIKLKAGYPCLIPPNAAVYVKADTAACQITIEAVEA